MSNNINNNVKYFSKWVLFLNNEYLFYKNNKILTLNSSNIENIVNKIENNFNMLKNKMSFLKEFVNNNDTVSTESLFHSMALISEINEDYFKNLCFLVDNDSLFVKCSYIHSNLNNNLNLELVFKDNKEVLFHLSDCDLNNKSRIRISGSSFFGLGNNQKELYGINLIINMAINIDNKIKY